MSLRQKIRLELEDGTEVEVEYSAVDMRAWEREHKESSLDKKLDVNMLSWFGWNAARRKGLLNGHGDTWEAFDAICASVEGVGEERPTRRAAKKTATRKAPGPEPSAP